MRIEHGYTVAVEWRGNRGVGSTDYRSYGRQVLISAEGLEPIAGSADPVFRGDADRWNPEQLLLAALGECHLLSYLYVAARDGIVVEEYTDSPAGTIEVDADGGGRFTDAILRPVVTISAGDPAHAQELHDEAARLCFIAASVNFPLRHEPRILVRPA